MDTELSRCSAGLPSSSSLDPTMISVGDVSYRLLHLSVDTRQKKNVLIGYQTWRVLPPNIWSLTAVNKQTVTPKVSCLYVFDQRVPLIFHFSQLSVIFLAQKQRTCLQKLFLTSKNSCKQYFDEQKQIKSTTAVTPNFKCLAAKHVMFAPN